ncbi:unnamed protein product [Bursaphelenchus xylophilus]|uniref:(pine wood nematode) hypothetical protein n=1 Tax=Bursaphelenchus xylophilus TaxID=6326 RepID=A0A1I7SLI7_BURXY|nr:unnamed protein product [Bursaphelenchus xylophilus]CAG9129625.1 unnamed protein product [Bursaphelenchus xylophilus]
MQVHHQEQSCFEFGAEFMSPGSQLVGQQVVSSADLHTANLLAPFHVDEHAVLQPPLHVQQHTPHSTAAAVAAALLAANCYESVIPGRNGVENVPVDIHGYDHSNGYYSVSDPCTSVPLSQPNVFCQPLTISTCTNSLDPINEPSIVFPEIKQEDKSWSLCGECMEPIKERYLLNVNSQNYHNHCLRCSNCTTKLEDMPSCFVKHGSIFCKQCYGQKFQTKCAHCDRQIQPTDWVRRARNYVFHLACFSCTHCKRQLSTGEQFSLQENRLLCKQHYLELVQGEDSQSKQKTKRVRTTFAEEQLAILNAHFQMDCNPDGGDLERIAALTGLSKRVTQVWFQNSRARQKKSNGPRKKITANGSVHATSSASGRSSRATSHSNLSPAPKTPEDQQQ